MSCREDGGEDDSRDDLIEDTLLYVSEKKYPADCNANRKRQIRKKAEKFVVVDGELYYKKGRNGEEIRYIRNREDQLRILKSCHQDPTSGHLGVMKTGNRIKERFLWKGIWADVKHMIASCEHCQKTNKAPMTAPTVLHPVPVHSPWHHVGIDFIGPIHPISGKGNRYILTVSDYFTKWVEAVPLPNKEAVGVAQTLYKIFMRMGLPKLVTSDQGREFRNNLDTQIMSILGIKRHFITPYHPQANGLDERWNGTLKQMLVKFCSQRKEDWDVFLDPSVYAYNTARHESTQYTPFELMFGRKAILPVDIEYESKDGSEILREYNETPMEVIDDQFTKRKDVLQDAKGNVVSAQRKQKEQYDRKHCSCPLKYEVGDLVLKKDFSRRKRKGGCMDYKWLGPYEVIKDVGRGFFALRCKDSGQVIERIHGAHLKTYRTPSPDSPQSPPNHESDSAPLAKVPRTVLTASDDAVSNFSSNAMMHKPPPSDSVPVSCLSFAKADILIENKSVGFHSSPPTGKAVPPTNEPFPSVDSVDLSDDDSVSQNSFDSFPSLPSPVKPCSSVNSKPALDTFSTVDKNLQLTSDHTVSAKACPSSSHNGTQVSISPQEQAQELKKLSNKDMVASVARIVASVDDCKSAEYLSCGFDDFHLLPSRRRSQLKHASNTIQCITEGQYESLTQYLLSIFPDFNSEVFSFVMDVLLPDVLNQVIMNKFYVTSEEASVIMYTMTTSEEVSSRVPSSVIEATTKETQFNSGINSSNTSSDIKQAKSEAYSTKKVIEPSNSKVSPLAIPISTAHRKELLIRVMTTSNKYGLINRQRVTPSAESHSSVKPITVDAIESCSSSAKILQPWISQLDLFSEDRDILSTSNQWLNDRIIGAAQVLLQKQHKGFQCTLLGQNLSFDVISGSFVQILHNGHDHWLTISTVGATSPNEVFVYDSLYSSISPHVKLQIAALMFSSAKEIRVSFKDVQMQGGVSDCGIFAIAFATAIVLGKDPSCLMFDQSRLRCHLIDCFEKQKMTMFPIKRERRVGGRFKGTVNIILYCLCRLPKYTNSTWIQCTRCKEWFHNGICVHAPKSTKKEPWFCPSCTS